VRAARRVAALAVVLAALTGCGRLGAAALAAAPAVIGAAVGRWQAAATAAGASPSARALACACDRAEELGDAKAIADATRALLAELLKAPGGPT
jgi:hypothetical protein